MLGMIDYKRLEAENRLNAFKHYVKAWKKQDPDTVEVKGDVYSYKTKRGVVKRFKSCGHALAPVRVNGFGFMPLE